MSYLLSLSVAPGSSVTKDFDPPLDMGIQAKVDFGESLTPAELAIWSEPRALRAGEASQAGATRDHGLVRWSVSSL